MPTLDALNFGPSGGLRFARNQGRSITGEALGAIKYPSPFFDIAQTYLPTSFKTMLRWCRYYFLTNPLINAVCYKMAEYPVTGLVFDSENEHNNERWSKFFSETLHFKKFEIEAGLDYTCYGNTFISLYFPFQKLLVCKNCRCTRRIEQMKYIFREYKFVGACPKCMHYGEFNVKDHYIRAPRDIRLIRWNPEYITIQHNEATGENRYYYTIPPSLANDVRMSKRHIIERIPQVFIEALRKNKALLFSHDNIYHMQRPTIAQKDRGWGLPMILPVLKDIFYSQILKKAQECVSPETLIETATGLVKADEVLVGDLVRTHLGNWKKIEAKWYRDCKEDEVGVKITPTGLRSFPATYSPNHPVLTIGRNEKNLRKDTKDRQPSRTILRSPHLYEELMCPASQLNVGDYVLYPRILPTSEAVVDVAKYTGLTNTGNYVYSGVSLDTALAFEALERGEHVKHDNSGKVAKRHIKKGTTPKRLPSKLALTEDIAYILGWYAGDGSCGTRHVEFTIGSEDPPHYVQNLCAAIEREFGTICTAPKDKNKAVIHATLSDVIIQKLVKGLIPGTARTKKTPREILGAPDPVKLAYLKGLFEADGCEGQPKLTLSTTSTDLAYDTYRLALHLGCIATVTDKYTPSNTLKNGHIISESWSYHVNVSTASKYRMVALWSGKEADEVTSGKSGFFWKEYFATRISAVEEVEEDTYIDFKVADDTTFCTPGTATKNCIMTEHIVPLRILFPQSASASSDVYSTINVSLWRDKIEQEIVRWRLDNNYIPILPIPVGQQTLGGDGKALMLSQEQRMQAELIVSGMGVPLEFIMGRLSFSGSNVTMRMLENHFLDEQTQRKQLVDDFIIPNVGAFMGWDAVPCHYKRFKMADDLQRSAFFMQLNQAGKLSDKSLLEDTDWDSVKEANRIEHERKSVLEGQRRQAITQAAIQGEAQLIMAKFQMRGQKLMNEMMLPPEQGLPPAEPMPGTGQSGMSPVAEGQMMNSEMGMMNQAGQAPPMEIPPAAGGNGQGMAPPAPGMEGAQSQLATPQGQGAGYDLTAIAHQAATWLNQMPDNERQAELVKMQISNPHLYSLVLPLLQQTAGAQQNSTAMPQPEQKPARRGPEATSI